MGVYATWVDEAIRRELGDSQDGCDVLIRLARGWSRLRPQELDLRRTLVIADFEPSRGRLIETLGGLPARLVLPVLPRSPIAGVGYGRYLTDTNPLAWDEETDALVPRPIDTLAPFLRWSQLRGRTFLQWWRRGIRRCWFACEPRPASVPPLWAATWKMLQGLKHKLRRLRRAPSLTAAHCEAILSGLGVSPSPDSGELCRLTHFTSSLTSGGAERQVCNTAIKQKQAGFDVRVLLQEPPEGRKGHYLPLLHDAGIPVACAGLHWKKAFVPAWEQRRINLRALHRLPSDLVAGVVDLAGELLVRPTDVLHCWLDKPNIVGLLAARLAGVPRCVLSLRAVNPERCPRLLTPWMKAWYQTASAMPGVAIVANSEAGARDYEEWLGLSSKQIGVVRNSFVPPPYPHPGEVARFRKDHGLTPLTPTVACVFRLDPEKRPVWAIGLLARLHQRVGELRVLVAGCGTLEDQVKAEIHRLGLEQVVTLLGPRKDVPVILAASQVLLLASEIEGTPNVSLEAQHFGCVPVLSDAGGSRETIMPNETGILRAMNDGEGLVTALESLLRGPARRSAMALAGRAFVAERFDPQRIHEQTLALYESLSTSAKQAVGEAA